MRPFVPALLAVLLVSACGGGDDQPLPHDGDPDWPDGGPCDAAPIYGCSPECGAGQVCVSYVTEHGWSSCNDYFACVTTDLVCPAGTCSAECEAALCPDPFTCDPTAAEPSLYACTRP